MYTDQENFTSPTPRLDKSFDSTAVVALLATSTVVIVLLAVMIISVIMFYFCFKKKEVEGTDMTQ